VLLFSLLLEGGATLSNVREIGRRKANKSLLRYLKDTKDSDLVVVFGENLAATVGLVLALCALLVAQSTGDSRWDGVGTIAIGIVLVVVAVFLAVEIKSLLIGESADPEINAAANLIATEHPLFERVLWLVAVQQGPGEVMVSVKVKCVPDLTTTQVARAINELEAELRRRRPEVRWVFVEPDLVA